MQMSDNRYYVNLTEKDAAGLRGYDANQPREKLARVPKDGYRP